MFFVNKSLRVNQLYFFMFHQLFFLPCCFSFLASERASCELHSRKSIHKLYRCAAVVTVVVVSYFIWFSSGFFSLGFLIGRVTLERISPSGMQANYIFLDARIDRTRSSSAKVEVRKYTRGRRFLLLRSSSYSFVYFLFFDEGRVQPSLQVNDF